MFDFAALSDSVVEGNVAEAARLTGQALEQKIAAKEVLDKGLLPAMDRVGTSFEKCEIYLPELLMAGDAMKASIELLRPELAGQGGSYAGRFLIGTVQGDLHDIGKNIVILMLEGNGWEVTDLGTDITPERFRDEVSKGNYDILGLSALLTFTMPKMPETIQALQQAGLRDNVKVIIGGAPVTQAFADKIGADAYASDAVEAVARAKSLLRK